MQRHIINKLTVSLVSALLATGAVSAPADSAADQQQYSLMLAGGQSNPWALPQAREDVSGFRYAPQDRKQPYPENQAATQYPGYRFVTPEILESLKQQQMQSQQIPSQWVPSQRVPDNYLNRQYRQPSPMMPWQQNQLPPGSAYSGSAYPGSVYPGSAYSGYPPMGGMGTTNPLFDVPAASPWNNPWRYGPDVMYQGESLPWLPDAAIGGIPPIPLQPLIEKYDGSEADGNTENGSRRYENNVFNPFTFGPNGNL